MNVNLYLMCFHFTWCHQIVNINNQSPKFLQFTQNSQWHICQFSLIEHDILMVFCPFSGKKYKNGAFYAWENREKLKYSTCKNGKKYILNISSEKCFTQIHWQNLEPLQCVQNSIFPNGKHTFPSNSLINF